MRRGLFQIWAYAAFVLVGCQKMSCQKESTIDVPSYTFTAKEIDALCAAEQKSLLAKLDTIGKTTAATFATGPLALEQALTELSEKLTPAIFLKYVSDNAEVREAAGRCESAVEQMRVEVFAREDLFQALKKAEAAGEKLAPEDAKLLSEFILSFKRNGLELSADKRKVFIEKRKKLVQLEADFGKELIEWNDWVEFAPADLEGVPQDVLKRLEKTADGKVKVTVKYPDYFPFMENAKNGEARKKMELKFSQKGGEKNLQRLNEALVLRDETAKMLGYANHAAYVLDDRMAKQPATVSKFLDRVASRLKERGQKDLQEMWEAKKADTGNPQAEPIQSWDWRYYDNLLKKQRHQIDTQLIKEYFPLDTVNAGMFEIYQTLLGVTFHADPSLPVWHKAVRGYRVKRGDKTVAVFYMDLHPREGKYGHAAAFTLSQGYRKADGGYQIPVSSIVANFNPPSDGTPSLLEHNEVETHFHEFGHIMHQVLTTAKHASLSGTSVKRDFVEAPSQMLENWVWQPQTLAKLSGHYKDPTKPLPKEQIDRLVAAKLLNVGTRYLRQVLLATLDLNYHTHPPKDSTDVYANLSKNILLIPIQKGSIPQAGFGHLMGGYDSGYYGYLWSEVYAQDMFTRFEKEGLLNTKTGQDYLHWILQPGGELEPMELLEKFLGRKPNEEAFYKSLGLSS